VTFLSLQNVLLHAYKQQKWTPIDYTNEMQQVSQIFHCWGTRWHSWLRHCVTSRKVAGSIQDVVIGIFHQHNPSDRTISLGLTQPLTEVGTRNYSRG